MDMENCPEQKNISQSLQDDEISLIDLFAVLLQYRKLIILITASVAVAVLSFSALSIILPPEKSPLPNIYTSEARMIINDSSSSDGSLSSLLNSSAKSGLGSTIGLSNLSIFGALAVEIAGTNNYLDEIIDKFDLGERYKIKKFQKAETRKALQRNFSANFDDKSGVFSLAFSDTDALLAASVVNFATDYVKTVVASLFTDKYELEKKNLEENIDMSYKQILSLSKRIRENENTASYRYNPNDVAENAVLVLELEAQEQVYKQLKTQYEFLKVQMSNEMPVFQILERAEVPDKKSKPSRVKLCIVAIFAAFFIAIFIAFALNAVENIKRDPEAVKKLSASLGKNRIK